MARPRVSHYRLGEPLGGGAMGRVYKAEDTLLGRTVALKFLAPHLASDPASVERFLREARMMAELDHPHICTVHEIGQDDEGQWFIAMAWYDGATLKERLAGGRVGPRQALEFARQTALGLACAHARGIVHRDVKPANLAITDDDQVKILDFGIARLLGDTRHTQPGALVGTVGYLAPEQTRGEEVTAAADIWSLGVVMFEMLTGQMPFQGEHHAAVLYAIAHDEPATLPLDGDPAVRHGAAIAARCLAKDPADRYPDADALASDLARALGGTAPTAPPPPADGRRRPGSLVLAVAAVLVLVVGVVGGLRLAAHRAGAGVDTAGVAVLPFGCVGDGALGQGLAWCLSDRLTAYDRASDAFWLVPPGEVSRYAVRDGDDARLHLGAHRSVQGSGQMSGTTINLHVEVADSRTGERHARDFHDTIANLDTWQHDVAAWVAGVLDPALADDTALRRARRGSTVPAAYLAFVRAMGHEMLAYGGNATHRDSARVLLSRAVAADSSFAQARAELGWTLCRRAAQATPDQAREGRWLVTSAARMDTGLAWAPYFEGMILEGEGDLAAAVRAYRRALVRDPAQAYALERLAAVLVRLGEEAEADAALDRAVAARPGYAPTYLTLGLHNLNESNLPGAVTALRKLVAIAPRNHLGWNYLGVALFYEDKGPEAEQAFRRSLAVEETASCYSNLGTYYYYSQRYQDAILAYRKSVELDDSRYDVWRNLAEAYLYAPGHEDESAPAYARAVAMGEALLTEQPADPRLLANLASFHAHLGHRARAEELLAALAATPADGMAAFLAAAAYEDLGRRDEALAHLDTALAGGVALTQIEEYPGFRNLRSDARYQDLIRRHR